MVPRPPWQKNARTPMLKVQRIAGWNKIKIHCILLVWGIFVGSAIWELISGFYPWDLMWKPQYPRDWPGAQTTLGSWIT